VKFYIYARMLSAITLMLLAEETAFIHF